MKSLVLILLILACSAIVVSAHEGMLALFTDTLVTSCSAPLPAPYSTADVALLYIKGNGPDMGNAWEFVMFRSEPHLVATTIIWAPLVVVTSCSDPFVVCYGASSDCLGPEGKQIAYIGTFSFLWINASAPPEFFIEVRENPDAVPLPGIIIVDCDDPNKSPYYVKGGRFVFNGPCDPDPIISVQETTWGGIKQLFRNE